MDYQRRPPRGTVDVKENEKGLGQVKKGYFITFEGTEGSGKSTQIKAAADFLEKKKCDVLLLREPGGTRVSEAIREILLNPHFKEIAPQTELLLYLAARAQIVHEKIIQALRRGKVVICDRYEDSTLAYQGYGRGMDVTKLKQLSREFVRGSVVPDLTFLLNLDPRKGLKRGGRHDRMERQPLGFHDRVQKGFLKLAVKDPKRFVVLDATLPKEIVSATIRERLNRVF